MTPRNTLLVAHTGLCLLISALAVACGSSSQARPVDASGGAANPAGGANTLGGANGAGAASGSSAGGTSAAGGTAAGGTAAGGTAAGGSGQAGAGNPAGGANASGGAGGASSGIRWLGRVDASNPAAVKFAWSGTGFIASVSGTKISVKLQTEATAPNTAFFQPVIDGTVGKRFSVPIGPAQTVVLANNLAAGTHRVELYRESEGMYGDSVFSGFADGTLVGAPAAPGRLIEIIGDSISAGYGNLGVEVHPPWDNTCTFSLDTESAYQAYGWQLARALNADVSIIAASGWGMYRDVQANPANVLSAVYANTVGTAKTPGWSFAQQPDAVVIDLGTNDSAKDSDPGQPYEDAYVAFLKVVRAHYAKAWIFLTIGPMTGDPMLTTMRTHLAHVLTTFGDAKTVTVDMPTQDSTSTGCDYHPNVAEDQKMAAVLKTAIAAKLGW